jgi:multiple antibiotic resistance protein
LSPAAISVTGGIALHYAGIPMMRGLPAAAGERAAVDATETERWRRVLFMPVFFPLTAGGTTFATMICFRAESASFEESLALFLPKGIPRLVVDTLDGSKAQRAGAASCKPTGDH